MRHSHKAASELILRSRPGPTLARKLFDEMRFQRFTVHAA
jgi:hypothetical protein